MCVCIVHSSFWPSTYTRTEGRSASLSDWDSSLVIESHPSSRMLNGRLKESRPTGCHCSHHDWHKHRMDNCAVVYANNRRTAAPVKFIVIVPLSSPTNSYPPTSAHTHTHMKKYCRNIPIGYTDVLHYRFVRLQMLFPDAVSVPLFSNASSHRFHSTNKKVFS